MTKNKYTIYEEFEKLIKQIYLNIYLPILKKKQRGRIIYYVPGHDIYVARYVYVKLTTDKKWKQKRLHNPQPELNKPIEAFEQEIGLIIPNSKVIVNKETLDQQRS